MPDNQFPEQPAATQQIINNVCTYKITILYFDPDKYENKENGWISARMWRRQVERAVKAAGEKANGSPNWDDETACMQAITTLQGKAINWVGKLE